jgi:hypothetical protein
MRRGNKQKIFIFENKRKFFKMKNFLVLRPFRHLESAEISSWLAGMGIECAA